MTAETAASTVDFRSRDTYSSPETLLTIFVRVERAYTSVEACTSHVCGCVNVTLHCDSAGLPDPISWIRHQTVALCARKFRVVRCGWVMAVVGKASILAA